MKIHIIKTQYFIFLLLFSISCVERKSNTPIDEFRETVHIVDYDSIFSDKEIPFGAISNIEIIDNMLVTQHMNDEYGFSFIDIEKGQLICRWGKIGEGPNEYLDFSSNLMLSDSLLIFPSWIKKELNYIHIFDILNKKDTIRKRTEVYPYTVDFRPKRFTIVRNKKITTGSFKEGRLGVLDSTNTLVSCLFDYPFDCKEVKGIYRGSVFQSQIKSNEKQNKFVISTLASDVFEIYQISENNIQQVYVSPFNYVPQILKKRGRYTVDFNKSIAGLMNVSVSDELICFRYSSQNYEELSQTNMASDVILCYNWDGEKIKKYFLPFTIHNFCIDNRHIYGIRYDDDEIVIYRFKMD